MSKDKKIAILMLCHTLPNQINDFIDRFNDGHFDFFIHVDKKSDIKPKITPRDNVWFVPDKKRVDVRWGTYSQIEATRLLIQLALQTYSYDYYWLCSGQDFPIKSTQEVFQHLQEGNNNYISLAPSANYPKNGYSNTEFDKRCEIIYPTWLIGTSYWQRAVKKAYNIATGGVGHTFKVLKRTPPAGLKLFFGSQWWCLNRETIEWISEYVKEHDEVCDFFRNTLCPDECFFHTLVMNSPYCDHIKSSLVYIDWSEGNSSPKILIESDYEKIMASQKLIARKIDSSVDTKLYQKLIDCGYSKMKVID